eukprot:8841538-Karenia_brevis.AAC.1
MSADACVTNSLTCLVIDLPGRASELWIMVAGRSTKPSDKMYNSNRVRPEEPVACAKVQPDSSLAKPEATCGTWVKYLSSISFVALKGKTTNA